MAQQETSHGRVTSLKDTEQFRQDGLNIPERVRVSKGDIIRGNISSLVNGVDWWSEVFYQTNMYDHENPKTKVKEPSRAIQQIAEFARITGKKLDSSEIRLIGGFEVYQRLGSLITKAQSMQFPDSLAFQESAKEDARIETLSSYKVAVKEGLNNLVAQQLDPHRAKVVVEQYMGFVDYNREEAGKLFDKGKESKQKVLGESQKDLLWLLALGYTSEDIAVLNNTSARAIRGRCSWVPHQLGFASPFEAIMALVKQGEFSLQTLTEGYDFDRFSRLTHFELQVLDTITIDHKLSNKQIAAALNVSEKAIVKRLTKIYSDLGVDQRQKHRLAILNMGYREKNKQTQQ